MSAPAADSPAAEDPGSWRWLALLVVGTLLVRGGILWLQADNLRPDPDGYRVLAHTLVNYGIYGYPTGDHRLAKPTAYRPPLYPLVLTKVGGTEASAMWPVAALHLGLGVATVLLTWWLGRQWELGAWSYLAAGLVAVDPILLHQSTLVMTETLATFLAVVALACLTRYTRSPDFLWAGLCGGALALAMLCRPTFAVWLALVAIPVTLTPEGWGKRIGNAVAFVLVAAAVLAPWVVRNVQEMGRPVVATTHGGVTLLMGNRPAYYRPREVMPPLDDGSQLILDLAIDSYATPHGSYPWFRTPEKEFEVDEDANRLAREYMLASPGDCALASLYRLSRLWGVLPYPTDKEESTSRQLARYAVAAWYTVLLALAAYGLWSLGWKLWQSPWLWGVLLCLAFTLVHTLYWTDLRMRAPLMPVVALVAAYAALVVARSVSEGAGRESQIPR